MNYIIQGENISKRFSEHIALDDVSLKVPEGKVFGLLGPNGAGKTTLIRIINGIIKVDSGNVQLAKEDISEIAQTSIGYLPEERGLYKKMKVGEQLLYLAQLKGLSKTKANEQIEFWLKKFEISSWKNKTIEELSKGMAQKIQFIATVIHGPKLLILDEPFSGFDPINTELITKEILSLKEQGVSIILSTHNMNSVEELCDEILILNNGKVVLSGSVEDIKNSFTQHEFEITFTGNMISFTSSIWAGFEIIHHEILSNKRLKVIVRGSKESDINQLLQAVISSCKIWSVKEKIPTMHEIFIQQVTSESLTPADA